MALRAQATKNESLSTCLSSEGPSAERPLRVFVFLGHGFGALRWTERWTKGEIPGLNERLPYGYHHAAGKDCIVEYSEDANENRLTELARRGMRRLLGCDLVHAWRNRKALFAADVVWTHTEQEHLAVLALWQCRRRQRRPKLIAQSVWLFDRWNCFSAPRRWLYRHLLNQADVLTVQSPENLKAARELFPQMRSEFMRFGVSSDATVAPVQRAAHRPVRLVALGNDMHRDWETLIAAAESWSGCRLRIGSKNIDRRLTDYAHNIEVIAPSSRSEIAELYAWADLAVVRSQAESARIRHNSDFRGSAARIAGRVHGHWRNQGLFFRRGRPLRAATGSRGSASRLSGIGRRRSNALRDGHACAGSHAFR